MINNNFLKKILPQEVMLLCRGPFLKRNKILNDVTASPHHQTIIISSSRALCIDSPLVYIVLYLLLSYKEFDLGIEIW